MARGDVPTCVCMCLFIKEDIFSKCHFISVPSLSQSLPLSSVVPSATSTTRISPTMAWISTSTFHHSEHLYARMCVRWKAVLSWARAECHWAHSDALLHMCNHDAPLANERTKGGRTRFLWLPWQGEQGRWYCGCCSSLSVDCWCVQHAQVNTSMWKVETEQQAV